MLPNLPKQNKHREADFGLKLREWIMKNPRQTCSIEIKDSRGKNSIPFSEITQQQISFALLVQSDKGALVRVQGMNGESDYIYLRSEQANVIIKYPKFFCIIPINNFIFEKEKSKRKSLTEDRAKEISTKTIKK